MRFLLVCGLLLSAACSPIKSSPNDEKHQLELTLHEFQTNLDDLRHDLNCYQTELQILDGRIKYNENALANLKQHDLEKQQSKIDQISHQIHQIEKKITLYEKTQESGAQDLQQLTVHANETTVALKQFKERIAELEEEILSQNSRFDELSKLRTHIESLFPAGTKIHRVKAGESLGKIARSYKTTIDRIKKANHLDQDLIVEGQELRIPSDP